MKNSLGFVTLISIFHLRFCTSSSTTIPTSIWTKRKLNSAPEEITVYVFTSPEFLVSFSDDNTLLTLIAQVKLGERPIFHAKVTAILQHDQDPSITVILTDDGQGADNFEKDGIYTGNLNTCKEKGRYGVKYSVKGTNDTCAPTNEDNTVCEPTGEFSRHGTGSISITDCGSPDKLTGTPVKDLVVVFANLTSFEYTLNWTESWNAESISNYTLRLIPGSVEGWNDAFILVNLTPHPAMTQRSETVTIPPTYRQSQSGTATIVIVATGKNGENHKSSSHALIRLPKVEVSTASSAITSNEPTSTSSIITSSIPTTILTTEPTITIVMSSSSTPELTTLDIVTSKPETDKNGVNFPVIIAAVVISAVAISGVLIYICMIKHRKNKILKTTEPEMGNQVHYYSHL